MNGGDYMLIQKKKQSINPAAAVATGAILGAGAVLAGKILNDKKNREKVTKVANEIKSQVTGYIEDMQKVADKKKTDGKEKLIQGKKELKKVTESSLDSTQDKSADVKKVSNV